MSKRRSDIELTDRNVDQYLEGSNNEDEQDNWGIQEADPETLKGRQIKKAVRSQKRRMDETPSAPAPVFNLFGNNTAPSLSTTAASFASNHQGKSESETDLKNMRGLNKSLLDHISKTLENDPFADLTAIFDKYKEYLQSVTKETQPKSSTSTSASAFSSFSAATTKTATSSSLPSFLPTKQDVTSEEKKSNPVFNFTPAAPPAAAAVAVTPPATAKPVFNFSPPKAPEQINLTTTASSQSQSQPPVFSFPPLKAAPSETKTGDSSNQAPLLFNFTKSSGDSKPPAMPVFNFVKTDNPTPLATPAFPAFTPSAAATPFAGFSGFGTKPAADKGDDDDGGDDSGEKAENDDDGGVRTNTDLIKKGEGEESDETLTEIEKMKIFVQKENNWIDHGVGFFKINKNVTTGKKRLLSRADGSGKVLLNTNLFPLMGVNKQEGKKDVIISTIDADKKVVKYLLRFKSLQEATTAADSLTKYKAE